MYCQVSDNGTAPSAGSQQAADPGSWPADPGHGLWLIGQVADEFTIDHGPVGVTATATFAITSSPDRQPLPAPRTAR